MTKIIGLTGGIGSGKTTIGNYFQSLGIPLYVADDAAREIMRSPEVLSAIKAVFGDSVFEAEELDRGQLASVVFNNPEKLRQLNQIIHPAVQSHFKEWVKEHHNFPLVIKEAAILFESGSYVDCDYIITVTAPLETRIERVMKRDQIGREEVLVRIKNQWTDADRISKSDYVIDNSNLTDAKIQATKILKKMTNQQN